VAVARVVQVAHDEEVHVIAVRHAVVTARRTVDVTRRMTRARVRRRALVGVGDRDRNRALVDMTVVVAVQVAVVEVVDVAVVIDRSMSTAGAVDVTMRLVNPMRDHSTFSLVVCMREREPDELDDVVVGEEVVDVLAVARPIDETGLREHAKLL
jgi:hypothetical protein